MPAATPSSSAPPSFYENLPAGGDNASGAAASKKKQSDEDGDLLKGAQGIYRVAQKMGESKDSIKPYTDKIKEAVKALLVQGLKIDPSMLEGGGDKGSAGAGAGESAPPTGGSATPPSQSDETHAA